mgnify:CR=1 FL=1
MLCLVSGGVERASQSLHPDTERQLRPNQWSAPAAYQPANKSLNNAEDLSTNPSAAHLSMSNQGPPNLSANQSMPSFVNLTNQTGPNVSANHSDLRPPNMQLHSSAPEQVTINGVTYQQVPASANYTAPASVHYQQAPAAEVSSYGSAHLGHPGSMYSPQSKDHTLTGDSSPHRSPVKHDTLDHPQRDNVTDSFRPHTALKPVSQNYDPKTNLSAGTYQPSGVTRPGVVTQPPQHTSTPVFDDSTNLRAGYRPPARENEYRTSPQAISNVYESVEQPQARDLPSHSG